MPASFIFIHDNGRWWQGVFVWGQTLLENNKTNSWPSAGKRHCGNNNSVRKKPQGINNRIPQQEPGEALGWESKSWVYLPTSSLKSWEFLAASVLSPSQTRSWSIDLEDLLFVKQFLSLCEYSLCNWKEKMKTKPKPSSLTVSNNLIFAGWQLHLSPMYAGSLQISTYYIAVLTKCWKRIQ